MVEVMSIESDFDHNCDYDFLSPLAIVVVVVVVIDTDDTYLISLNAPAALFVPAFADGLLILANLLPCPAEKSLQAGPRSLSPAAA